jgi:hypothetical protein
MLDLTVKTRNDVRIRARKRILCAQKVGRQRRRRLVIAYGEADRAIPRTPALRTQRQHPHLTQLRQLTFNSSSTSLHPSDANGKRRKLPELSEIDHLTIREWMAELTTRRRRSPSIARKLAALRRFFSFSCVKE